MGIKIYKEIEKYLAPEEIVAYNILLDVIGIQNIEELSSNIEVQLPEFNDSSFDQFCLEVKNGEFLLAFFRNFYENYNETVRKVHCKNAPPDEAIERVGCIIMSSILVENIYEYLGLDSAINLLDSIVSGLSKTTLLLYFPKPEIIINHCERIKEELLRSHNNREFFYWEGSSEELQNLHDLLKDKNYIVENMSFVPSFKKEEVPPNIRTEWKGSMRDLVFLTYYLFNKLFGKSFYNQTYNLFYKKEIKYSIDSLRWTYHQIKSEFENHEISKRKELYDIIQKINS